MRMRLRGGDLSFAFWKGVYGQGWKGQGWPNVLDEWDLLF